MGLMINFNNINGANRVQKVGAVYQNYDKVRNINVSNKGVKDTKDEVILSAASLEKQAQMQKINDVSLGIAREERIENLALKVQNNNYLVNAYDVASKFIETQKGI